MQNFELLTQALRRGRRRIRPEYVPELCAWLLMMSKRYENYHKQLKSSFAIPHDKNIRATMQYVGHCLRAIQELIDSLCDGFDGFAWRECTDVISSQLGIAIGSDLPDELNPAGKVSVPELSE